MRPDWGWKSGKKRASERDREKETKETKETTPAKSPNNSTTRSHLIAAPPKLARASHNTIIMHHHQRGATWWINDTHHCTTFDRMALFEASETWKPYVETLVRWLVARESSNSIENSTRPPNCIISLCVKWNGWWLNELDGWLWKNKLVRLSSQI